MDLALPLFLSKEDFSYRTSKPCRPCLNPCPRFEHSLHTDQTDAQEREGLNRCNGKAKKRVSFADHKGLSLTRVKVFSEANDPIDIPLNIQEMLKSALTLVDEKEKLVLDFSQPSSDYLQFRQRLEKDQVCLEHCMLKEKAIAGTVKVKNLSFEKSVKLRVTFDAWKTHRDVECQFVKDTYPGSDRDTFSFEVPLLHQLGSNEHVEFAILYEANGSVYWDNNMGHNYRVVWSAMKRSHDPLRDSFDLGIHFDRYGSPTCSHGIFPEWPSYAGYENFGPYY